MSIPESRLQEILRAEAERKYPHEMVCELRLPGRLDGDTAFARAIYKANMPCELQEPGVNGDPCFRIRKRGEIRIERAWLEEASKQGCSITWRLLPKLRKGYLLSFDDDEMIVGALPPEGATEEEAEAMRHALSGDELDQVHQRSASLQWAASEAAKHPKIKPGSRQTPAQPHDLAFQQGVGPARTELLNVLDGRGGTVVVETTPGRAAELSRGAVALAHLDSDLRAAQRSEGEGALARLDSDLRQAQRRQQAEELVSLVSTHDGATALADMRARRRRR